MEFRNKKGQVIGTLREGIFRKVVHKERHLMKIYNAWGIDYDALVTLKNAHCEEIRIKDVDEDVVYKIPFKTFFEQSHVADHGDGQQAFCDRVHFTTDKKQEESPLQVRNQKEDLIAQIVEKTNETDKKGLARRIAIAYNTLRWTEMELHALLKKADDPSVHNYTAFVKYSATIHG